MLTDRTVVRFTGGMAQPLNVSASRSIPVSVEAAYDAVLTMPLPRIFNRRYAALPPIREVRDQEGVWGTVGQTRTIVLTDGFSVAAGGSFRAVTR